jgi:hypothetical protein
MGVVYILTNQAMPGLIKIGRTTRSIEERLRELTRAPGVPVPFECFLAVEVRDAEKLEQALHEAFRDHRTNLKREFFNIAPDRPAAILKMFQLHDKASRDVTPKTDIVDTPEEQEALNRERQRRSNFRFSKVSIGAGSVLQSVFDQNITCIVVDDKYVDFRGKIQSLSAAALSVAQEHGRNWSSIAGPQFWEYNGKTLSELRAEAEGIEDLLS